VPASTPGLLLLGTVLAGLGFGPANLGGYRVIMARAAASNRAGLIAAISIVNYLAFGLPALIAGIATSHFGLHDTALVYSVVIALLAAAAAGGVLFEGNDRTRPPGQPLLLPNLRRARAPCHRTRKQRSTKPSQRRQPLIIFNNPRLTRPQKACMAAGQQFFASCAVLRYSLIRLGSHG
jgi:MFS family permease